MRSFCVVLALGVLAGCASSYSVPKGNAREVRAFMGEFKEAVLARDLDRVMGLYADDFSFEGKGKAPLGDELKFIFAQMEKYEGWVNVEDATVTVDGTAARVVPVVLGNRAGVDTVALKLVKRGGVWRILEMTGV